MRGCNMNGGIANTTDVILQSIEDSTSEEKSIPISTEQEVLPLNKNKPWRLVIRRIVSDGGSSDEDL